MRRQARLTISLAVALGLGALAMQHIAWTDNCAGCGYAGGSAGSCAKPGALCGSCGPRPPCSCMNNSLCNARSTYSGCQSGAAVCGSGGCGGRGACRAAKGPGACGCVRIPQITQPIYQGWVGLRIVPASEGECSLMVCVKGIDGKPVAQPEAELRLEGPSGAVDVSLHRCRCCLRGDVSLTSGEHYRAIVTVNRPGVRPETAYFSVAPLTRMAGSAIGKPCVGPCPRG